jgi:hypothetical protein
MIGFTLTMWKDIDSFGTKMAGLGGPLNLYGPDGKLVLRRLIGLLLFAWTAVLMAGLAAAGVTP